MVCPCEVPQSHPKCSHVEGTVLGKFPEISFTDALEDLAEDGGLNDHLEKGGDGEDDES